jgi:hypothetical protein
MPDSGPSTRYRFGPLERRGVVAGWRGGQIAAVATALLVAVGVVRASPSALGVGLALAIVACGIAAATWPIAGRTAEEWTPHALRHARTIPRGRRGRANPFAGLRLVRVDLHPQGGDPATSGRAVGSTGDDARRRQWSPSAGILHDRTLRTFTALVEASAAGFVLLGETDNVRRVDAWAGVLASLAREGSAVHRLQWVERVVHHDGVCADRARSAATAGTPVAARRSYDALLGAESDRVVRHEVFLTVSIHSARAGRAVKAAGGGDAGACAVLLQQVAALRRRLADADVDVGAVLAPTSVAAALRSGYAAGRSIASTGDRWPWPMGVAPEWGRLRVDGTWVASYWVAEWPRTDVGPDFLGSLLLGSEPGRAVSVVMKPLAPLDAARKIEQARTADIADAELRRRGGFLATARRRREEEVLARREIELADGHAHYRFSGYVTVTATDPDALDRACGRAEQDAGQAGIDLRRCYGDQVNAFLCTLPLGRGLA